MYGYGVGQGRTCRIGAIAVAAAATLAFGAAPADAAGFSYRDDAAFMPEHEKVFSGGGLKLFAECQAAPLSQDLDVFARSERNNAILHFDSLSDDDGDVTGYGNVDDFDAGPANEATITTADDDAVGRIVYRRGKRVVSVDYLAEDGVVPGENDCLFAGVTHVAKAGSGGFVFSQLRNSEPRRVFKGGGLTLRADCDNFMTSPTLVVSAKSLVDGAAIHASSLANPNDGATVVDDFGGHDLLNAGDKVTLTDNPAVSDVQLIEARNASGEFVFAHRGAVVTIHWLAQRFAATDKCLFAGTVDVRKRGSSRRIFFRHDVDEETTAILSLAGFKFFGACDADGPATATRVSSTQGQGASLHIGEQSDQGDDGSDEFFYAEIDDMITGVQYLIGSSLAGGENALGQLVYARGSRVVSADYLVDEDGALGSQCAIAGTGASG